LQVYENECLSLKPALSLTIASYKLTVRFKCSLFLSFWCSVLSVFQWWHVDVLCDNSCYSMQGRRCSSQIEVLMSTLLAGIDSFFYMVRSHHRHT